MGQRGPPSPAPSGDNLALSGLQFFRPNTAHFPQEVMDNLSITSQPHSRYGSPGLVHETGRFDTPSPYGHQQHGVMVQHQQSFRHNDDVYGSVEMKPERPSPLPYGTPTTSPTTSNRVNVRPSRQSQRLQRPDPLGPVSSRIEKSPAKRRRDRAKAPKRADRIQKPLSELAKENPQIEIADIGAYVHRSAEVRVQEVKDSRCPGKIKRPMNAFMLYRKAYQNLAKLLCTQNNHQVVSQVCGEGWPMEPDEMREQFNTWAKIERENHQQAHPNYKFTPSKPRKLRKEEDSDVDSTVGDAEWHPSRRAMMGPRKFNSSTAVAVAPSIFSPPYSTYSHQASGVPKHPHPAYSYGGPERSSQVPFEPVETVGSTYYQNMYPTHGGYYYEDMIYRKPNSPAGGAQPPFVDNGGVRQLGEYPTGMQTHQDMIDPSLIPRHPEGQYNQVMGVDMEFAAHQRWAPNQIMEAPVTRFVDSMGSLDDVLSHDPQLGVLRGDASSWQVEELGAGQTHLGDWDDFAK